ncbi:unnamed protein product [Ilex paraguariensis]|uniref:Uncharacterized protein n=1 Tax=Ilex paraguariensis TaxID=185542 RepID=A0ABC8RLY5_9AQUA
MPTKEEWSLMNWMRAENIIRMRGVAYVQHHTSRSRSSSIFVDRMGPDYLQRTSSCAVSCLPHYAEREKNPSYMSFIIQQYNTNPTFILYDLLDAYGVCLLWPKAEKLSNQIALNLEKTKQPQLTPTNIIINNRDKTESQDEKHKEKELKMVCLACLLPLFLVPIVNILPLLFDFIIGKVYRMLGWEYRKPERAPAACPYKPAATNPKTTVAREPNSAAPLYPVQKSVGVDDGKLE